MTILPHSAKVRLRVPEHPDPEPPGEWQLIAYRDEYACGHETTMCPECQQTWELDYEVELQRKPQL